RSRMRGIIGASSFSYPITPLTRLLHSPASWRRQDPAILRSLAAHFEVMVRFSSNVADCPLGGSVVPCISCHHTDGKRPVCGKDNTRIGANAFQFAGLVCYLNAVGQFSWNVARF